VVQGPQGVVTSAAGDRPEAVRALQHAREFQSLSELVEPYLSACGPERQGEREPSATHQAQAGKQHAGALPRSRGGNGAPRSDPQAAPRAEAEFDLALYTLLHTKSGRKQYVRINKAARAAPEKLRVITRGSDFVCPNQDHRIFRLWWEEVLKDARVTNFHWHDLRHTFASRLVMAGTDIYTVSRLLRHGNVATSQRYAHLTDTHLQQAVERLDGVTAGVRVPAKPTPPVPQSIQ